MGIYAFLLFGSNFLAPFFAGFINDAVGWRWFVNFGAFWLAATAVIIFFFMEETMYFRQSIEGVSATEEIEPATQVLSDKDLPKQKTSVGIGPSPSIRSIRYPPPKTYLQKLNFFNLAPGRLSKRQMFRMMYRPLNIMVYFRTVDWAGVFYRL
jgi:MFS family permease